MPYAQWSALHLASFYKNLFHNFHINLSLIFEPLLSSVALQSAFTLVFLLHKFVASCSTCHKRLGLTDYRHASIDYDDLSKKKKKEMKCPYNSYTVQHRYHDRRCTQNQCPIIYNNTSIANCERQPIKIAQIKHFRIDHAELYNAFSVCVHFLHNL